MADLYALLGLSPKAAVGASDLRSAYRRSALQAHPDKGGSEEQFHAVLTAFEVLSCRTSREAYDAARARGASAEAALAVATGRAEPKSRTGEAAGRGTASSRGATVALERLRQVLSKMSREKRQEALQQLPAEVQAALVSFMETSKAEPPARAPKPRAARAPALVDEVSGATGCAAGRAGTRSIGRGILRQATSPPSYKASVFLRSMFVASRPSPSLEHILQLHSALLRARELLETCDVNSHRFREAFEEACREAELDAAKALQMLTFTAIIPAYYEVNRQIKGRQTADLDAAFALRERLLEARATGWPALREEWIAIMQSPPEAGTGHKAATAEEAARIADAAWEAGIPQRAKMEARRAARPPKRKSGEDSAEVTLEEAAAAVSKVLKAFVALVPLSTRRGGVPAEVPKLARWKNVMSEESKGERPFRAKWNRRIWG
ncbi:unnamed protein product [Durusdinium trenchii]|uniref:J domain-containing protein n=1 Tax=Durusdinium trenchii TaxID=1381693 RepID=A0ABP0LZB9_9DINO